MTVTVNLLNDSNKSNEQLKSRIKNLKAADLVYINEGKLFQSISANTKYPRVVNFFFYYLIRVNRPLYEGVTNIRMYYYQFKTIETKNFLKLLKNTLKLNCLEVYYSHSDDFKYPKLFFPNLYACYKDNEHLKTLTLFNMYTHRIRKDKSLETSYVLEREYYVTSLLLLNKTLTLFKTQINHEVAPVMNLYFFKSLEVHNRLTDIKVKAKLGLFTRRGRGYRFWYKYVD